MAAPVAAIPSTDVDMVSDSMDTVSPPLRRRTNLPALDNDSAQQIINAITQVGAQLIDRIDQLGESVNRLEGSIGRLEGSVDRLEGSVSRLEGSVDRLEQTVNNPTNHIALLEGSVNTLTDTLNALQIR